VKRAALNSDQVDECIMGNVLPLVWDKIPRGKLQSSRDYLPQQVP